MARKSLQRTPLYTAAQVRELDNLAITHCGITGYALMEQAAEAAFAALISRWPDIRELLIFCGAGNNGGDGYVIARLARQHEMEVQLVAMTAAEQLTGSAAQAAQDALAAGIKPTALADVRWHSGQLIVDALLGIGLQGAVRAPFAAAIELINQSALPVLAVDIPSGLCADTGNVLGCAVHADMTVTFIGQKRGLFTAQGPDYSGEVCYARLAVPDTVLNAVTSTSRLIGWSCVRENRPFAPRVAYAHKGMFGHVLIIGGNTGMGGAVILAAEMALKAGAGLVSVATREQHIAPLLARCPAIMARAVNGAQDLMPLLAKASVVVIGPGLGQDSWAEQLLQTVLENGSQPLVLDADALNLLAAGSYLVEEGRTLCITPHPMEAARLLQVPLATVQADRFAASRALQQRYQAQVLLKGAGTLLDDGQEQMVVADGNPAMASAGMGDVLSGLLGACLAQQGEAALALRTAACLHSAAADNWVLQHGRRGLIAPDLIEEIRILQND